MASLPAGTQGGGDGVVAAELGFGQSAGRGEAADPAQRDAVQRDLAQEAPEETPVRDPPMAGNVYNDKTGAGAGKQLIARAQAVRRRRTYPPSPAAAMASIAIVAGSGISPPPPGEPTSSEPAPVKYELWVVAL